MYDSSDLSSEDEFQDEVVLHAVPELAIRLRKPRVFRNRNNPIEMFDDAEFKMRYRLSKNTFMFLLEKFGSHIEPKTKRNKSVSAVLQLSTTLRYYATGAFQQLVGDHIMISKQTVSRIIRRVTHYIALLKQEYVNMPLTYETQNEKKRLFYNIRGFPGVIGAIDCTHIKIQSPGHNAERFRNRKGYFSINVQAVCDANTRVLNIVARFPGSVHDSTIFNDGPLKTHFDRGDFGTSVLLGDNGYACRNYLLTPILQPSNLSERAYNNAHIATRNPIERCFGVVKRRFPCLALGLRSKMDTNLGVIVACFTLHNIALEMNDDSPPLDLNVILPDEIVEIPTLEREAGQVNVATRNMLLLTRFNRR